MIEEYYELRFVDTEMNLYTISFLFIENYNVKGDLHACYEWM